MPEPLSATVGVCWLTISTLQGVVRRSSAISGEAGVVSQNAIALLDKVKESRMLFGAKQDAISSLFELAVTASAPDWDGNGGQPVSQQAITVAEAFLVVLPQGIPMPDITVGPSGSIILEWLESRNKRLSIMIKDSMRLAYAWLDGSDIGNAVARFNGSEIPPQILHGIQSTARN
jgi:hypothetical protein